MPAFHYYKLHRSEQLLLVSFCTHVSFSGAESVFLKPVMLLHSHIIHGCFCATTAQLSTSNRDRCRIRARSTLLGFGWFHQFTLPPALYFERSTAYSLKIPKASSSALSPRSLYIQHLDVSSISTASTNASMQMTAPTSKSATPTSLQLA